jgi:hypothetical protein
MWKVLVGVLFCIVFWIVATHKEDTRMVKLKQHYYTFIQRLPEKYEMIKKPMNITGVYGGDIGTNVNKGGEIYVCIDGDLNDQFHVLLHELAHSTVDEYDHSDKFWKNFEELRKIAQDQGLYTPVKDKPYCGKMISDS